MNSRRHTKSKISTRPEAPLKVGLVRLVDAAPYIMAGELGFYEKHGLKVQLSWELGWASIKHKVAYGQLDAAHGLATIPLTLSLGREIAPTPVKALKITSRLGNAITLSTNFRERGVSSNEDFRQEVRSSRGKTRYTFGIVSIDSTHNILLRSWLRKIGIDPDNDVGIVVVPPGQAIRNLRARTLDGYCVGEPWNSMAVREQLGWCPALSNDISPGHPEKVLLARRDLVEENPEKYEALKKAIQEACNYCANLENATQVARKMRKASVLGPAATGLEKILRNQFDHGDGTSEEAIKVIEFCSEEKSKPSESDIKWLKEGMVDCDLISDKEVNDLEHLREIY